MLISFIEESEIDCAGWPPGLPAAASAGALAAAEASAAGEGLS
jgi:hypothetical protein